jgi:hypothetical protein
MKATFVIPDELYRQVKAKSALEGRPIRDVAVELFQSYVSQREGLRPERASANDTEPTPSWFGALGQYASQVRAANREQVMRATARGIATELGLEQPPKRARARARRKA